MTARRLALLAVAAGLAAAPAAHAQSTAATEAEEVYRAGRPAEAVAQLDAYLEGHADDAEAQYLLARILYADDTPARDARRAARAIDRAVRLDPDNVVYLVAQLEGQRVARANFLTDLVRAQRRLRVARRILALDPDNAYAHEELGTAAIRDYYQYRNAIALPGLAFDAPAGPVSGDLPVPLGEPDEDGGVPISAPEDIPFDPADAVYADDRFDLDVLRAQNVGVVTFETRARRAYDDATAHLRAALHADPRRRSVYDHVARLAEISGRWGTALPDLREMYVQFPDDVQMWLYTGLAAQRTARYEDADAAFREALRRMAPAELAVFTDLTLILPPDEAGAFRADPDGFARRYWASRDPRFLNAVNERRTEHYARLTAADLLYRSDDLDRPGWQTERGLLFVRYGPPRSDVLIDGTFARVVETYAGFGDAFTPSAAEQSANRFNVWEYGPTAAGPGLRLVFEDPNRNGQFRLYSPPAFAYGARSARNVDRMDFVQRAREAVRETPERYTFTSPGRQVELPYRVTAFKGAAGRTDLYVHYGIPLAADAPASGDIDLTVRTGAFLVGADRSVLAERRRTVYGLRAAQIVGFAETRLWTNTEPLQAPPGPNEVSLEFETADGGTSAVQRRAVDVPDFSRPGLQLSDVMLAYDVDSGGAPAAPGRVVRGGVAVQPAPWGVFGAGQPVYVYVELYGLALRDGQTDFEVEAELVPKDVTTGLRRLGRRILGRREQGVASTFEAQGSTADDAQDVQLDTTGQPPGLYTLTVTVRDRVSGATAERETDLLLEGETAP